MPTPASRPRAITVIGNGIVGTACAIALQARDIEVTLVSPDAPMSGASNGNAGHIATEQVEPLASPAAVRSVLRRLFLFGGPLSLPLRGVRAWLPFSARLLAASTPARFQRGKSALGSLLEPALPAWRRLVSAIDAPDLLLEHGHFIVWESDETARAGRAHWARTETGTTSFRDATQAELAQLQALTSMRLAGAIRFSGSGQIADLIRLAQRMTAHFHDRGGRTRVARAERIDDQGRTVVLDDSTVVEGDGVLIAAGASSASLARPLGLRAPLIAERGYHLQSPTTNWPAGMPPVVFEDRSMIVTRFESGLRACSFVEFAGIHDAPDTRKWSRLRSHLAALGLPFTPPVTEWMGARPTLPDYLPAIGRSQTAPAIAYAFGHQHLGLTLAAITAECVAAMFIGEPSPISLEPFDLQRFN